MTAATRACPGCGAQVGAALTMCLYCGLPLTPAAPAPLISQVPGSPAGPPPVVPVGPRAPISVVPGGPAAPPPPAAVGSPLGEGATPGWFEVPPSSPPPPIPLPAPVWPAPVVPLLPTPASPPSAEPAPGVATLDLPSADSGSGEPPPWQPLAAASEPGPSWAAAPAWEPSAVAPAWEPLAAGPEPAPSWPAAAPQFGPPDPVPAAPATVCELVFDTGDRVKITGPGLIGRDPRSRDPAVTCTAVADPAWSLSKIHLEYGVDAQGAWVKDRGSTNGSTLIRPGAVPVTLLAGQVVRLRVGDAITLGQRRARVEGAGP